ncbi:MAG: hypothetical protein IPJ77_22195 [Planctomycetes bacterium]|nr:hypothetical protein [Planctomycetota bacterium]
MEHARSTVARGPGPLAHRAGIALLFAYAATRALVNGARPEAIALTTGFLALHVFLPGWCAWRALRPRRDDGWSQAALGLALGLALQVLAFVGAQRLGIVSAFAYWPLVSLPLAWWSVRRSVDESEPQSGEGVGGAQSLWLLAILAVAIGRAHLLPAGGWWRDLDFDGVFHVSNAAELGRTLPFEDARIAGLPFNYHYFSYATAAGLRETMGVPVREGLERLLPMLGPVALALGTFALARALWRSANAGLVAAALVVLHADLGFELVRVFGLRANEVSIASYLAYGVYRSPSMVLGLVFFSAIAFVVTQELRAARGPRVGSLVALVTLAIAAAGTKGTVMPVVVAACCGLALVALASGGRWRPGASLALVTAVAAAPMTLALAFGGGSHAGAMFRVVPWHALVTSGSFAAMARALGATAQTAPAWLEWVLAPLWVLLFYGPCLFATAVVLVRRRAAGAADPAVVWLVTAALAGSVLAFALGAPGVSQLFFADVAHVALAVLASAAFVRVAAAGRAGPFERASGRLAFGCVLALSIAPVIGAALDTAARARRDVLPKPEEGALFAQYEAGLAWIREHAPRDAVFLARGGEILFSAHAERRAFLETERADPHGHAAGWHEVNGRWWTDPPTTPLHPERLAVRSAFATGPDVAQLRTARELLARAPLAIEHADVWAIVDRLRLSHRGEIGTHWELQPLSGLQLAGDGAELVFENEVMRVYRLAR